VYKGEDQLHFEFPEDPAAASGANGDLAMLGNPTDKKEGVPFFSYEQADA